MSLASGAGPNYNSVVATFCHNIARDLTDHRSTRPTAPLRLVYIDDVVDKVSLHKLWADRSPASGFVDDEQSATSTTVGEIAATPSTAFAQHAR